LQHVLNRPPSLAVRSIRHCHFRTLIKISMWWLARIIAPNILHSHQILLDGQSRRLQQKKVLANGGCHFRDEQ
jgi:hypothetical protein